MSEEPKKEELLSTKSIYMIAIISAVIAVVGVILLALGYNVAFYVENSTIRAIFEIITFTGEAIFFIILIAIFYITYDKKFAKNLAFSLLFSVYVNEVLKNLFQDPRPPTNADPTEDFGLTETGYGFPSGHSQNAVATWGYLAQEFKNKTQPNVIIPAILSAWILLIALSRVIIGVHDLQDIVGGLLIGILFLVAFIHLEPIVSEKVDPLSNAAKITLITATSLALFIIGTIAFPTTGQGLLENPVPYADAGGISQVGGVILGLGIGYVLENEHVHYDPTALSAKQKLINLIVGLALLIVLYYGMGQLADIFNSVIYRYVRYAIISFILTFLTPLIFTKLNK